MFLDLGECFGSTCCFCFANPCQCKLRDSCLMTIFAGIFFIRIPGHKFISASVIVQFTFNIPTCSYILLSFCKMPTSHDLFLGTGFSLWEVLQLSDNVFLIEFHATCPFASLLYNHHSNLMMVLLCLSILLLYWPKRKSHFFQWSWIQTTVNFMCVKISILTALCLMPRDHHAICGQSECMLPLADRVLFCEWIHHAIITQWH